MTLGRSLIVLGSHPKWFCYHRWFLRYPLCSESQGRQYWHRSLKSYSPYSVQLQTNGTNSGGLWGHQVSPLPLKSQWESLVSVGTCHVTHGVKKSGWRRVTWRLWGLQCLPRAGFRHLSAFVTTIVKVRVWVLAAPSLVASQTDS